MDEEDVSQFMAIAGCSQEVARHFLRITDGDAQQAIQLYFDSPDLAAAAAAPESQSLPPQRPSTSRAPNAASALGREDSNGVINLDSDDDIDMGEDDGWSSQPHDSGTQLNNRSGVVEDDEALARRLQEEIYSQGGGSHTGGSDQVRAPIARTTETLIGGDSSFEHDDVRSTVLQHMRARGAGRQGSRPGVFNQYAAPSSSIWEAEDSNPEIRRHGLAAATGGASENSSKAARLAELFRPPFDLMSRLSWDDARDEGKSEHKWILVNIQDPAIFDCQTLNRDLWKDETVKDTVKENFIFMQYTKDDPRGQQYIQYYFQRHEDPDAYPHIAIVDPRTGEQVKVWSGLPAPKPADFSMQLYEFLDRYSLDVSAKNPVAKRKPESHSEVDVGRLTEEQMLDLAMKNSLALENSNQRDPDELTKSPGDISNGKATDTGEPESAEPVDEENTPSQEDAAFAGIPSDVPHTEPPNDPTTTRIQFRHSGGRIVRRFHVTDRVQRIYEWLKAEPIEGKGGLPFELKKSIGGSDLIGSLHETIEVAGLKNATVMVEYIDT